ncbi:hypothetical protein PoB_006097500 [Plakobranchus ocellatus]|uniref:Uncharacterized protein n=1 Tax=Plakobranchus ocellatus TaxID=259542 RepID=A0AAV4CRC4_9GAST|nr:hypothetical protein PoB_006097500 [Plakobranchus ocellatus]
MGYLNILLTMCLFMGVLPDSVFSKNVLLHSRRVQTGVPYLMNRANTTQFDRMSLTTEKWARLFLKASEVIDYMYDLQEQRYGSSPIKHQALLFIYTTEILAAVHIFEKSLSLPNATVNIVFELAMHCPRQDVLGILLAVLDMETSISGAVVASSQMDCITSVLNTVATETVFKWRHILHVAEWIALTVDPPESEGGNILPHTNLPDFVTFLFISEESGSLTLDIAQKSRTEDFETGHRFYIPLEQTSAGKCQHKNVFSCVHHFSQSTTHPAVLVASLRKHAALYLLMQKSVMAGMRIPAVFLESEIDKTAYLVTEGNQTRWEGFSVALLNLLSEALDFTSIPFPVTDGGFYVQYEPEGNVLGIVGMWSPKAVMFQ